MAMAVKGAESEMKTVSIIMPVFNMADRILLSAEAILNQTYSNIEVILIDDGSTDASLEECLNFANSHDQVKVFHTENNGAGPARNYGIQVASGDYAYFPDADDILPKDAIEILVRAMEENQSDLVVFGYDYRDHQGQIQFTRQYGRRQVMGEEVRQYYEHYLSFREPWWIQGAPWNKFFDLRVIKAHNIIFPAMRRHQDEVFISRYVAYAKKIQFIPDILYTYFANDVKKEWDKYPIDYLTTVMALRKHRENIIIKWNPDNSAVLDIIEREYLFNVTKGFELSFSKKMGFNFQERKDWLRKKVFQTRITDLKAPNTSNMWYQATALALLKKERFNQFYWLLSFKVFIQKNMYPLFLKFKKQTTSRGGD